MLVTGQPPKEEGIVIVPPVDLGIAVFDDEPLPTEASPFDMVYVHVIPFMFSESASRQLMHERNRASEKSHFIGVVL